MPSKTEEYLALAQRTANGLTRYWESWTAYLTTASRLYKYRFEDQLMIYAQRPDATACADYDIWNNRMNRYVRRGSKGIALLDESSGYPRLHYVFDVSDTGVRRNSRAPDLWQYNDDAEAGMADDAIQKMYDYDRQQFNSERTCIERTQELSNSSFECSEDETSPLMQKYMEATTIVDTYHETKSSFAWIGEIENEQLLTALENLDDADLKLLTLYAYEGYNTVELSKVYHIAQQNISKKILRITKFLKNFYFRGVE